MASLDHDREQPQAVQRRRLKPGQCSVVSQSENWGKVSALVAVSTMQLQRPDGQCIRDKSGRSLRSRYCRQVDCKLTWVSPVGAYSLKHNHECFRVRLPEREPVVQQFL